MSQYTHAFSVIIPTHNRPESLQKCLNALVNQNYPSEHFEIIVVDDGSETPLNDIINCFEQQVNITLLTQPQSGCGIARNTGAIKAKGKILAFTDDDCIPEYNWLTAMAACFENTPDHIIGGKTINALPNNSYSTASQMLISYLYEYYNRDPNNATFFAGNNFAIPADGFHNIGGFETAFLGRSVAEDRELCARWISQGNCMTYAPEAIVYHANKLRLATFWRQHFHYGRGAFYFRQVCSIITEAPVKLERLSFYSKLITCPYSHPHNRRLWITGLMTLSQIATVAGFSWEKWIQTRQQSLTGKNNRDIYE